MTLPCIMAEQLPKAFVTEQYLAVRGSVGWEGERKRERERERECLEKERESSVDMAGINVIN